MSLNQWTTFVVNNELFAVRVHEVQEVLCVPHLTPVPLAPAHVAGLLNLRGQIMTAIDLRERLQAPFLHTEGDKNLVVLCDGARSLALVVDAFGDILDLDANDWVEPPDTIAAKHRAHIFGLIPIRNRIVLGLSVSTLDGIAQDPEAQREEHPE